MRDIATNRPNDTANFVTENTCIQSVTRIKRERLEDVTEIHSRGFHFDQDLTRSTLRQLKGRKVKRIEVAAFARFQTQRKFRIEPLLARRATTVESPDIARFAAQSDLAFRVLAGKFVPKRSRI